MLTGLILAFGCDQTSRSSLLQLSEYPNRQFAATTWDTVGIIGGANAQDTTLIYPWFVRKWNDDLAVLDYISLNLRVVDQAGRLKWVRGREGQGPGEIKHTSGFAITPDGHAWLLDPSNQKILEFDKDGGLRRELSLRHLPAVPTGLGFLGDAVVFTTMVPAKAMIIASGDSLQSVRSTALPWPEPIGATVNFQTRTSGTAKGSGVFVLGFKLGPGFIVLAGDSAVPYRFIDDIPFAEKSSPRLRQARADSARNGALSVRVVGEEIFFLFGGRPRRHAHVEGEPTVLIDVYGLDGRYRRSYLLPFSAREMETVDGETFYLSTEAEEMYPQIVALRPRTN